MTLAISRIVSLSLVMGTALSTPAQAQMGAFAGFQSIHANSIESNAQSGEFRIPSHFTASRSGLVVSADFAAGNMETQLVAMNGNVVVHITRSLNLIGKTSGLAQGPSTLRCEHLDIDGIQQHYHASGKVEFVQSMRSMHADRAELDEATNELRLEGHVFIEGAFGEQAGGGGGFDRLHATTMNTNSFSGDFSIPKHFTGSRGGVEISGNRARGNISQKFISIIGDVVARFPQRSAILKCDRLDIDETHRLYHAVGNIRYTELSRQLVADRADMNEATGAMHLQGHVHVSDLKTLRRTTRT